MRFFCAGGAPRAAGPGAFLAESGETLPFCGHCRRFPWEDQDTCRPGCLARFVLAEVYLERLERSRSLWESRKLGVLARRDAAGKDVVIDDGSAIMGMDISDNGRIILYEKATEYRIWNEDFLLPGDTGPCPLPGT